jgi:hypothetical protein
VTVNEFKKEVERLYEKWHKKIAPKDLTHYVVWNEHLEKAEGISGCTVDEKYLTVKYDASCARLPAVHRDGVDGLDWTEIEKEVVHEVAHTLTWVPNRVILDAKIVSEKEAERIEEANTVLVDRAIWAAYHMEPEEE